MPWSYGLYFSWANIEGHPKGGSYLFTAGAYSESPGASIEKDIPLTHDAARAILGGNARIPSEQDFNELLSNCTTELTTLNGVYGCKFTSNINGKSIFLPACGQGYEAGWSRVGSWGEYWSRTYLNQTSRRLFNFANTQAPAVASNSPRFGMSIRAVSP